MNTDGMKVARMTRPERKARTRDELLAAAGAVFMRRGFHGASLEEIADEAGYTKGAVYSNFADKDALFVAVLEARYERRVEIYTQMILEQDADLDDALLAVTRFMADADTREPAWLPLLAEFVSHASRHDRTRREYLRVREGFLQTIAGVIAALGTRHGVTFRVSPLEAARASSVLLRGVSAERLLDPELVSADLFVELHTALLRGLIVREAGAS
jgi:AcrR family transcriptional regulator